MFGEGGMIGERNWRSGEVKRGWGCSGRKG